MVQFRYQRYQEMKRFWARVEKGLPRNQSHNLNEYWKSCEFSTAQSKQRNTSTSLKVLKNVFKTINSMCVRFDSLDELPSANSILMVSEFLQIKLLIIETNLKKHSYTSPRVNLAYTPTTFLNIMVL